MRSVLFAGATRPDLLAKLPRSSPDVAVVDLEDAVPPDAKEDARATARQHAAALAREHERLAVYVRVNPPSTRWFAGDMGQALDPAIAGVVVPKVERPEDVQDVREALRSLGLEHLRLFAGLESALGVANCERILEGDVHAAYFGAEDYVADVGGRRTPGGEEVLFARSRVRLAARIHGVVSVDIAMVDIRDMDGFRTECELGRALGFDGKLCVHPDQVTIANAMFGVTDDERDRAERMLAAAEAAAGDGVGAIEFEGEMVDEPALRMARRTLAGAQVS